jgi:hypothetical protein
MDFTSQITHFTSETSFSSTPRLLWEYYLEYLWFYEDGSWVARVASTFRVLAFVLIIPMILISLLVRIKSPYAGLLTHPRLNFGRTSHRILSLGRLVSLMTSKHLPATRKRSIAKRGCLLSSCKILLLLHLRIQHLLPNRSPTSKWLPLIPTANTLLIHRRSLNDTTLALRLTSHPRTCS